LSKRGTSVFGRSHGDHRAEHILAKHAATPEVAKRIYELDPREWKARAKAVGRRYQGGQPTQGNIKGGLNTIEEKSLGSIAQAGSVADTGGPAIRRTSGRPGLVLMDSPAREPEILRGSPRRGCTVIAFSTGRERAAGISFRTVVKITGNRVTATERMPDHFDLDSARSSTAT
jgi:altronate dehydratase large subunit